MNIIRTISHVAYEHHLAILQYMSNRTHQYDLIIHAYPVLSRLYFFNCDPLSMWKPAEFKSYPMAAMVYHGLKCLSIVLAMFYKYNRQSLVLPWKMVSNLHKKKKQTTNFTVGRSWWFVTLNVYPLFIVKLNNCPSTIHLEKKNVFVQKNSDATWKDSDCSSKKPIKSPYFTKHAHFS